MPRNFVKQDYLYTPLFCEENVWQLCQSLTRQKVPADQLLVLYLSNIKKQIVVFNQQFADPGHALLYDYHVILKYHPDDHTDLVFDFDTRLPFPCDWDSYRQASFPVPGNLPGDQQMMIREIPAGEYLAHFSSDRSHMAYLPESEHPSYPCIHAASPERAIDLTEYWRMDKTIKGASKLYPYSHE